MRRGVPGEYVAEAGQFAGTVCRRLLVRGQPRCICICRGIFHSTLHSNCVRACLHLSVTGAAVEVGVEVVIDSVLRHSQCGHVLQRLGPLKGQHIRRMPLRSHQLLRNGLSCDCKASERIALQRIVAARRLHVKLVALRNSVCSVVRGVWYRIGMVGTAAPGATVPAGSMPRIWTRRHDC